MKLAIAGVGGLVCEALLEALTEAINRPDALVLLSEVDDDEVNPIYAGRTQPVQLIADFDFAAVDVVVFVDEPGLAEAHLERALTAGVDVLDATGWSSSLGLGELVQAGFDTGAGPGAGARHWVLPDPLVAILAEALRPVQDQAGLVRIDVTACLPVSVAGRAGIDTLAGEAARLLNGQKLESGVFSQQVAFNLLIDPLMGPEEAVVQAELRSLLQAPELQLQLSSAVAPVFYGMTIAIHMRCAQSVDLSALERSWKAAGIALVSAGQSSSPVSHAKSATISLASVRTRVDDSSSVSGWLIADNVRKGGVINIIQLVEILKKSSI